MSSTGELACFYAAIILQDDGIPITADKISTLVKAANLRIEPYWPGLFAKLFEKRSIEDLILNAGTVGTPTTVAASVSEGGAVADAPVAVESKKEEPNFESDDDFTCSLCEARFFHQSLNTL